MATAEVVDLQVKRLMASFNAPETDDPGVFMQELRGALLGIDTDILVDGVTSLIRGRKYRTFPSIGEIVSAASEAAPRPSSGTYTNLSHVYASDTTAKDRAVENLRSWPLSQKAADGGWLNSMLEWMTDNGGEFPTTQDQKRLIMERARGVNDRLLEIEREGAGSILMAAAAAILYRREKTAELILGKVKEAAE
jgi:hypothetical protein